MTRINVRLLIIILSLLVLLSCGGQQQKKKGSLEESIDITEVRKDIAKTAKSIFYNMYLPCDMIYVFENTGLSFNGNLLNPIENAYQYTTNSRKACNLGVYGVDFGYVKLHDEKSKIKEYTEAINRLSRDLGIPDEHITYAMDFFKKNQNNVDSLYYMTCQMFEITDSYLNQNERQGTAALIILGGWVEALYITSYLLGESFSTDIMHRIAQQKYSLQSMISLLTISQDNIAVTNYLVMLNNLKKEFEGVDLYFPDESAIDIDTVNKRINTANAEVKITEAQFLAIRENIAKIREHIIKE